MADSEKNNKRFQEEEWREPEEEWRKPAGDKDNNCSIKITEFAMANVPEQENVYKTETDNAGNEYNTNTTSVELQEGMSFQAKDGGYNEVAKEANEEHDI